SISTDRFFELFKAEWKNSLKYAHEKLSEDVSVTKYFVGLHNLDRNQWKVVEFDSSGDIPATCSCAKFETEGLLCKHILFITRKKQLQTIPKHYILHRWILDAKYQVSIGYKIRLFYDLFIIHSGLISKYVYVYFFDFSGKNCGY
ncbi:SWIM domain-containing protein, partial [Cephalotus follicularis]